MAIDFPSSPTAGQQYTFAGVTYTFTAQGTWAASVGGVAYTASSTAPSSPAAGNFWYDLSTGVLSLYVNDGNSSQWVQVSPTGPDPSVLAPLASPVFTGDPQAPTPATADNDTSIATTAYVRSVVRDAYGVRGLTGSVAAGGQIATLNFHECLMHDSAGVGMMTRNQGVAVNQGTLGAAGRDAALTDGDVSFYAIWGSVLSTSMICSNANPSVGPVLPSGYTHWGYLTTLKRSGGNFFAGAVIRGNKVFYGAGGNIANGVNSGDGVWGSYSSAAYVPAVATNVMLTCYGTAGTAGGGGGGLAYYVGHTNSALYTTRVDVSFGNMQNTAGLTCVVPNVNQTVYHAYAAIYNVGNFSSNAFYMSVTGYEVPNGD